MQQCIVLGNIIEKAIICEEEISSTSIGIAIATFIYILTVMVVPIYILFKRKTILKQKEQEDQIGRLYFLINLRSNNFGLYYFSMTLLRIFIYVMISSVLTLIPVLDIQLQILLNTISTIWYFQTRPHYQASRRNHEMFHEVIIMIGSYHLFLYSNAYTYDVQYVSGYSF